MAKPLPRVPYNLPPPSNTFMPKQRSFYVHIYIYTHKHGYVHSRNVLYSSRFLPLYYYTRNWFIADRRRWRRQQDAPVGVMIIVYLLVSNSNNKLLLSPAVCPNGKSRRKHAGRGAGAKTTRIGGGDSKIILLILRVYVPPVCPQKPRQSQKLNLRNSNLNEKRTYTHLLC